MRYDFGFEFAYNDVAEFITLQSKENEYSNEDYWHCNGYISFIKYFYEPYF